MKTTIGISGLLMAGAVVFGGFAVATEAFAQTATKLKCNGCIKSKQIKDGKVKAKDLHSGAKPGGVNFDETSVDTALDAALASIISTTVTAPGPGYVTVMASWYFSGNANDLGRCYLATTPAVASGPYTFTRSDAITNYRDSTAMIRTFDIAEGDTTFHLNCEDDGTDMVVANPLISAIFTPQRYGPPPPDPATEQSSDPDGNGG